MIPSGATDCHVHVFDPRFPYSEDRAYTPGAASGEQLDELHWRLGVSRAVLVQPSPYGTDNSCLLAQLRDRGERARGVVVVDPAGGAPLREWHAQGVRGARVNLATFAVDDPAAAPAPLRATASAIADLGWHLQVFTSAKVVAALADEFARLPVPVVFDHFALASPDVGLAELTDLLRSGAAYVKLSAPHRISTAPDHTDVEPLVRALAAAAPDRLLWGTDWPHTGGRARTPANRLSVEPFEPIDDARALERLLDWTGPVVGRRILVDNPVELYGF
ncbi:amidohydrolase family protein [Amycolatopsis rhabdoformis]|uniref:Amidohydrolase family protein n=1 Tax=Amycolatopsis rhabdoformis TaxID=1448059 RepID=A0ABZ1IAW6_9PSEU|nr:amidohydrolase family protein [Amycolatopsis rhabdoformis]WSE31550.1 amidohydrolase family protein [Amycolatopsis rhabdoformis]